MDVIPEIAGTREEIRMECGLPLDKKILLYVGRIDRYKHPEHMVELIRNMPDDYIGVMIGEGIRSDQIAETIKADGLSDRLIRIKKIPNCDIHKYFRMADYFLNFNGKEIFGMAVLEAMYQECTVIAMHAPGPDSIIEDKVSGYLVNDISEMKQIILSGEKLDRDMIRSRIEDHFTWDRSAAIINNWIMKQ